MIYYHLLKFLAPLRISSNHMGCLEKSVGNGFDMSWVRCQAERNHQTLSRNDTKRHQDLDMISMDETIGLASSLENIEALDLQCLVVRSDDGFLCC